MTRMYDWEESASQVEKASQLAFGHHSTHMYDTAESEGRAASGWYDVFLLHAPQQDLVSRPELVHVAMARHECELR